MEPVDPLSPVLRLSRRLSDISSLIEEGAFSGLLSSWIVSRRWFASKSQTVVAQRVSDLVDLGETADRESHFFSTFFSLTYESGEEESYFLPLAFSRKSEAFDPVAKVQFEDGERVLEDALMNPSFGQKLLSMFWSKDVPAPLTVRKTALFEKIPVDPSTLPLPKVLSGEQSNTSLLFGRSLILKCYRRPERGGNCDYEMGAFFSTSSATLITAPLFGAIEYAPSKADSRIIALLSGFVPNQGDAWSFFRESPVQPRQSPMGPEGSGLVPESDWWKVIAGLGKGTADLHRALSGEGGQDGMSPEPARAEDLQLLYDEILDLLARLPFEEKLSAPSWWPRTAPSPDEWFRMVQAWAFDRLTRRLKDPSGTSLGWKIRCHGDYHLGQILVTPELGIVIIDFEGEPSVPLSVRRQKRSPLSDVAGMVRSFHYLSRALFPGDDNREEGRLFFRQASGLFLSSYRNLMSGSGVLPEENAVDDLLGLYLLRKGIYEMIYELNNRPEWCQVPFEGILDLVNGEEG